MLETDFRPDLLARIDQVRALALEPGSESYVDPDEVDVEAWNHVGDPLCEALLGLMRERKLMGGDIYATARRLEAEGVSEAVAFFADVEAVPSWLDIDALRKGASLGRRNPVGMLFGMHGGLPFTYIDPATAEVMGSTGRLARNGDYGRRFWETATGFVGSLDVDGMLPGGERWVQWVRIRFLHTMIRMGIIRGGQWPLAETAIPISQVASASTAHIFGPYRVNIIRYFGGVVSPEEADGFALMWRWVARIEGANNQLLGRTHAEQFRLQERQHQFLYARADKARKMTADVIDGSAAMRAFVLPRRLHSAVVRQLLSPRMVQTLPGRDVPGDLGVPRDPFAENVMKSVGFALRIINQVTRTRVVRRLADRRGQQLLDHIVDRGLDGIKAEYRGTPVAGKPTDH
ncbi:oxygenase MpaB family protein [Millisia brevis]|uniref:oxygenase MpaB family protein n=1 Tax=Millisia brevis TaxID=264148 RepID=UPI0012ECF53D|nr:oxygenase MpaB family protein [Millisia brevis]